MAFDLVARLSLQDDFTSRMKRATSQMDKASTGVKQFTKQVAGIASAIGVTALVSKGFNMITSSIDGAIDRYDTLQNFAPMMEGLGYSADVANESIKRLTEGIQGLPTALPDAVSGTKQIASMTGDLSKATDAYLALNNALIASGAKGDNVGAAMDQMIKSMASGKMEMDNWTSLMENMPMALNKVAEAFGHTGSRAKMDLYDSLKDGNITMDQLIDKFIELNKAQGGFAELAISSSGGIRTAWTNMKTAITAGLAGTIEQIDKAFGGTGSIEGGIGKMKTAVSTAFAEINAAIVPTIDTLREVYGEIKPWFPVIKEGLIGITTAVLAFKGAMAGLAVFKAISSILVAYRAGVLAATLATYGFNAALWLNPVTWIVAGIAALIAGIVLLVRNWDTVKAKTLEVWEAMKSAFGRIGEWFAEKWAAVKEAVSNAMTAVGTAVANGLEAVKQWFITKWNEALAFVRFVFTELPFIVAEKLGFLLGTIVRILVNLPETFARFFQQARDWAIEKITALPGRIAGFLTTTKSKAASLLGKIAADFSKWFQKARDNAIQFVKELPGKIAGFISQIPGKVAGVIKTVYTKFKELGAAIPKAIADGFNAAKNALGKAANWAIDKIIGGVGNLRQLGSSFISGFADGASGGGNNAKSHYHGIDSVPYDGYIARLHKGERVQTAQEVKAQEGGKFGGGITINMGGVTIREEADIDRLADAFVRKIQSAGGAGA